MRMTRCCTCKVHNASKRSLLSFFKACPSSTIRHSHSYFFKKEIVFRAVPYPVTTTCALRSRTAFGRHNSYCFFIRSKLRKHTTKSRASLVPGHATTLSDGAHFRNSLFQFWMVEFGAITKNGHRLCSLKIVEIIAMIWIVLPVCKHSLAEPTQSHFICQYRTRLLVPLEIEPATVRLSKDRHTSFPQVGSQTFYHLRPIPVVLSSLIVRIPLEPHPPL